MVANTSSLNWFPYVKTKPQACLRMFCFPYAGGGATLFRRWSEQLPATVEVLPVQLPGRENLVKEQAYTSLGQLVAALAPVIQPYCDKPFIFFGHSMGAFVCYELARYLQKEKLATPRHLFISANRAPHLPNPWPLLYDLPEDRFRQELLRLGGTPQEVLENEEVMAVVQPLLRADFTLCETYQYVPGPPLTASISAFGGRGDKSVNAQELNAWRAHTNGIFMCHMFAGNHFFLHAQEAALLTVITQTLQWILLQL
ncbi:MAG TPA: alpha/beta fold hydrolase [Ktedonobacteraceae bacterium]|jgi:medium-chain acyl-[acyl-carrier-protein] hydrolase|nr:alpha/beta fold hydrolase [Ktedonobacteraceae bacterium]